jgi:hypothetical protein
MIEMSGLYDLHSRAAVAAADCAAEIADEGTEFPACFALHAHLATSKTSHLKSMRYRIEFPMGNFFVLKNMAFADRR